MKPANVLVDRNDRVVVSDFGFAQLTAVDSQAVRANPIVGGTLGYLAPELLRGASRSALPTADIYSIGALLYAIVMGRPPISASEIDHEQLIHATEIPVRLNGLCARCLASEPATRYQTAAELLCGLELLRSELG